MADSLLGKAALPMFDAIVDPKTGMVSPTWSAWLARLPDTLYSIPSRLNALSLTNQTASLAATDFSGGSRLAGLYRLSYYARITTAASVASSLTVTLGWTDGGVACSQAGAAMTGNTTATAQSGTVLVHLDTGTAITYATTYSTTGTTMAYALAVSLEKVLA